MIPGAIALSLTMGAQPVPYQPSLDINPSPVFVCPETSSPYLASPNPYPYDVDDVRRPGFGGKEWQQFTQYGGEYPPATRSAYNPGPNAYGAPEDDNSVVYVRLSSGFIAAISPWEAIDPAELPMTALNAATRDWIREYGMTNQYIWTELEEGRQAWLRERGYTYSVRSFTGYGYPEEEPQANGQGQIKPVTVMERPTDQPKFKQKMQVRRPAQPAEPSAHDREISAIAKEIVNGRARLSVPPIADRTARAVATAREEHAKAQAAEAARTAAIDQPKERRNAQAKTVATR